MKGLAGFSSIERTLIVMAAVAVILLFVQFASSVFSPILLAAFLASIATPPLYWMRAKGVPKYLALGLIVFILFDIGSLLALVFTGALEALQDRIPTYQERLSVLSRDLAATMERIGMSDPSEEALDALDPQAFGRLVRSALLNVGDVLGSGFLVLLAVTFMLLETAKLKEKTKVAFGLDDAGEERLTRLLVSMNHYMALKSAMSLATALFVYVWLTVLGIDFAIFLALVAFLANFIPFLGVVIMTIPGVLLALLQTDPQTAGLVAIGYIVANTLIGTIMEPRIMGRSLGISTLTVFLGLMFWGWLLGTVGVFLSVPLTMGMIALLEASPQTRPIAIMLK